MAVGRKSTGRTVRKEGGGVVVDTHRLTVCMEWDVTLGKVASKRHQGSTKGAQESLGNISRGAVLNGHPLRLCMLAGGAEDRPETLLQGDLTRSPSGTQHGNFRQEM